MCANISSHSTPSWDLTDLYAGIDDPKIEEARQRLEDIMVGKTKEMFKDSSTVRKTVKEEVDSIINSYDW